MDRLVSVIEAFIRPRDNYTTFARTMAFFSVAGTAFWMDATDKTIDPWVVALLVAGSLNLFALLSNMVRALKEREINASDKAREQLEALAISLESFLTHDPEAIGSVTTSMARASSFLKQAGIPQPGVMSSLPTPMDEHDRNTMRRAVPRLIRDCDDRVAELRNRPSRWSRFCRWWISPHRWWRRFGCWLSQAGSFRFRSEASPPV